MVGRDDGARDRVAAVERPQGQQRDNRGAVRVGDDPGVACDLVRIDLRYDQRYRRIHAKGRGIVDDHGAMAHRGRCILARRLGAGREQRQVDAGESAVVQRRDGDVIPAEWQHRAGRSCRGVKAQFGERELAAFKDSEQFAADCAGRADNRNHRRRSAQTRGLPRVCRWAGHVVSPLLGRGDGCRKTKGPVAIPAGPRRWICR